jgi:hypothetical protein
MRKSITNCILLLTALSLPAAAQVNQKKYAGYFLVGQFGEICTMCEAVVLCESAEAPIAPSAVPTTGSFTLYHLHTRTFWSQVSTIWEWFVSNFDSSSLAAGHERPVTVHRIGNGQWQPPIEANMRVALEPALLSISDGHEIERTQRRWRRGSPPVDLGYCERLPLWDALAAIEAHAGRSNGHE